MFAKKTLLAFAITSWVTAAFAVNPSDFNYDTSITTKQLGIDVNELLRCGSDYGTGECRDGTEVTQSGYKKNLVTNNAKGVAKKTENNEPIANTDPDSTKKLGINVMNDVTGEYHYNNSRDIGEQKDEMKGLVNEWSNMPVDSLKATYNTGIIPTDQGADFKYLCMKYTDAQIDKMANNDTDMAERALGGQCLSIRTVSNTNDKALANRLSRNDELREDVKNRAGFNSKTNTQVTNLNSLAGDPTKANSMSYACDFTPESIITKNGTCNTKGVGRHQICTQEISIVCGEDAKGRDLPECVSGMDSNTVKLAEGSSNLKSSFKSNANGFSLNENWHDGKGSSTHRWTVNFTVNNPDKVDMILKTVGYDNKITINLNGALVMSAETSGNETRNVNINLRDWLRVGSNSMSVTLNNFHGPAKAVFDVTISPESYVGCMCKETWKNTCVNQNVEL